MLRLCSPLAQVCSPSAQVKAAVAHVRRLKQSQRKKEKINPEPRGIWKYVLTSKILLEIQNFALRASHPYPLVTLSAADSLLRKHEGEVPLIFLGGVEL
jgi:hypothetical protein